MTTASVSRWRQRRGRILAGRIRAMAAELGRPLRVIDVGGRHDYWDNVGFDGLGSVLLVNILPGELGRHTDRPELFTDHLGDARNLAEFADAEFGGIL